MKKTITLTLDPDDIDNIMAEELRNSYVQARKYWSNEPDHEKLCEAMLTILDHIMSPNDFEAWYETIKEL